jgi:hypothetical protein
MQYVKCGKIKIENRRKYKKGKAIPVPGHGGP